MPKVLDFGKGKISVHIYLKDHLPQHVHIESLTPTLSTTWNR